MPRILACLSSLILGMPALEATTLARLSLEEVTQRAETIFIGACTDMTTEQHQGRIYSRIRFRVSQVLKGPPMAATELVLPGGSYGGYTERLLGMPRFAPDQEVVLFLTPPNAQGHAWPVGLGQGTYRITRGPSGQPAIVRRDLGGATLYGPAGAAKTAHPPATSLRLDEFLDTVNRYITPPQNAGNDLH